MIALTARNAGPIERMRQLARGLPAEPSPPVAPSVAFVALAAMHNLCGQLLEAMTAMDAEVVNLKAIRPVGEKIAAVIQAVATEAGLTPTDITGDRRSKRLVLPRHVAMALARELTSQSLPTIARAFGDRDHTTVMYALRRVECLRGAGDPETVRLYEAAKRRLQG